MRKISVLGRDGSPLRCAFTRIVRVEPNRRLACRIVGPEESSEGVQAEYGYAMRGYTIFNLHDMDGKTLISYETVAEMEASHLTDEQIEDRVGRYAHQQAEHDWLEKYIPRLRELLLEHCQRS
jgi:hypothetical protein